MLEVEGLDLRYGAARALEGVSMTAAIGEVACVLGRNGVGKTSLMRAIMGLERIHAGSIRLDGRSIERLPAATRARLGVAYVPQGRDVFPLLTVRENLETARAALPPGERFDLDPIYALFPILKDMGARRGGDLSGGQQQQLAIGRALATKPKLLILDEPTEGIQPSIIKTIGEVIAALRDDGSMAIVLVEQYFDFARALADRFTALDRGKVVAEGRGEELDHGDVRRHLTV